MVIYSEDIISIPLSNTKIGILIEEVIYEL